MRSVIFLHHNYPAQFKHLIPFLLKKEFKVYFITDSSSSLDLFPEVNVISTACRKPDTDPNHAKLKVYTASLGAQLECASRFKSALISLKDQGLKPDFVIGHTGWGAGLYTKTIFPNTKFIAYCEWWFTHDFDKFLKDYSSQWVQYDYSSLCNLWLRNSTNSMELLSADKILCPTFWQRDQLPDLLKKSCTVIFDGIDTNFFVPNINWKPKNKILITYTARGLEPVRGFDVFVGIALKLLSLHSDVHVLIVGDDKIFYGSDVPVENSFGKWSLVVLKEFISQGRVKYLPRVSLVKYARILKASHLHFYLSQPFVPSWSLFEAMSTACNLVCADNALSRSILSEGQCIFLDTQELISLKNITLRIEKIRKANANMAINAFDFTHLSHPSLLTIELRDLVESHYSLQVSLKKWALLLCELDVPVNILS